MQFKILDQVLSKTSPENIIALILRQRGIKKDQIKEFLKPTHPEQISLFDLGIPRKEFNKVFERLETAYKQKESVVVYTDYDVDGITGGAIVWQTLHNLGFLVMPYIPNRKNEGYGFSDQGITKVIGKYSPKLIITVDHGITGEEHIKKLKQKSIDVIVIDHHLKTDLVLKSALALIYSQEVSGSGVAYYFCKELLKNWQLSTKNQFMPEFNNNCLFLAGFGTIADIIKLEDKARGLAYHALNSVSKLSNVGFKALLVKVGLAQKKRLSSYDVGYILAPRINAVGRLGSAMNALRLLCTKSLSQAKTLADQLNLANLERQKRVEQQLILAEEQVKKQLDQPVLFAYSDQFDEGIVGLLASKFKDRYYKPALVGKLVGQQVKGSARSISGINITELLKAQSDILLSYGGHEKAAGFSLKTKDLNKFKTKLIALTSKIVGKSKMEPVMKVDIQTVFQNINLQLARGLFELEPYGEGNYKPLFMTKQVEVMSNQAVGKTGKHNQLLIMDKTARIPLSAIMFNGQVKLERIDLKQKVNLVYSLDINNWRGERLVLNIRSIYN